LRSDSTATNSISTAGGGSFAGRLSAGHYLVHGPRLDISPSADLDNYAFGDVSTLRINNTAAISISGLVAGIEGQELTVYSTSASNAVTLLDSSGLSSISNQFILPGRTNYTLVNFQGATLRYTDGRWRLLGK
jgi:hypothetical protein